MTAALAVLCAVVGLAVGSFLNVVIWRVPRGESVVSPPSACPSCGHEVRPRDNVPVVSWLLLRGRCRDCGEPISPRYPAVELGTAVLFALTAVWFGPTWVLPAFLYLAAISVALAVIDVDVKRLPNAIVLPSYPVAGVLLAGAALLQGEPVRILHAAIGGAALYAVYFLVAFVYPAGMGFGDVKLAGVLGLYLGWLGWAELAVGWFAAYLVGGLVSVGLLLFGGAGRKTKIPFGPYLIIGAYLGVVVGPPAAQAYLSAFGF